jgi:hypothetical protein
VSATGRRTRRRRRRRRRKRKCEVTHELEKVYMAYLVCNFVNFGVAMLGKR